MEHIVSTFIFINSSPLNAKIPVMVTSAIGIASVFLPWVTYPKSGDSLYGYMGDGLILAFFFLILAVLAIFAFPKKGIRKSLIYISLLISAFCSYSSYRKFVVFAESKENFNEDNPAIAAVTAGYYLDYGCYVLAVCSFLVFFLMLYVAIKEIILSKPKLPLLIIGLATMFLISSCQSSSSTLGTNDKELVVEIFNAYKESFLLKDYQSYIGFQNPTFIESMGGKKILLNYLEKTDKYLRQSNSEIVDIQLDTIIEIIKSRGDIQAVVSQIVILNKAETSDILNQTLVIESKNNMKKWLFTEITNKNQKDIEFLIPDINKAILSKILYQNRIQH